MAHVGALPETNDILSPVIIALFGMPSPLAKKEEECHFFLETITKEKFLVLNLPFRHIECFKTWASHTESTVRCAYCRTTYPYEDACFLCLQEYTEKLNCTTFCHAKIHTECTIDLTVLLSLLTHDHSMECGRLVHCNKLWLHA